MKKIFSIVLIPFSLCISYPERKFDGNLRGRKTIPYELRNQLCFEIDYTRNYVKQNLVTNRDLDFYKDIFLSSELFSNVIVGKNEQDFFLDIKIRSNWFSDPFYGLSYAISALTGFIIPGYEKEESHLVANLYLKDRFLKQYKFETRRVIQFHLLYMMAMFSDYGYELSTKHINESLIQQLIIDMSEKDLDLLKKKPERRLTRARAASSFHGRM